MDIVIPPCFSVPRRSPAADDSAAAVRRQVTVPGLGAAVPDAGVRIVFEPQAIAVHRLVAIVLQQHLDRAYARVALAEHDRGVRRPAVGRGRLEPRVAVDRTAAMSLD